MAYPEVVQKAYLVACEARKRAYAPYSKFMVGAAVKLTGSDIIVPGCNVENASFGGTVCAERLAILSSISQYDAKNFEFVVVVTNLSDGGVPCALCLQVMAEFCSPAMPIYLANLEGIQKSITFDELLPHPFKSFSY